MLIVVKTMVIDSLEKLLLINGEIAECPDKLQIFAMVVLWFQWI